MAGIQVSVYDFYKYMVWSFKNRYEIIGCWKNPF